MEIKTSEEIEYWLFKDSSRIPKSKLKEKENTKWVSVDSLIEYLNNNTYGFRESGINNIDADELIKAIKPGE